MLSSRVWLIANSADIGLFFHAFACNSCFALCRAHPESLTLKALAGLILIPVT